MPRHCKTTARYREARAIELALAGGSWDAIAKDLGYADRSGAWKAAHRALKRRAEGVADRYLARALVDLEIVQERSWAGVSAGSVDACRVAVRAIEQRCSLLGLG